MSTNDNNNNDDDDDKKKPRIIFSPGCFDDFDGTQEELDELVLEINKAVTDGTFFENAREITSDDLDDLPDYVAELLIDFLKNHDEDEAGEIGIRPKNLPKRTIH